MSIQNIANKIALKSRSLVKGVTQSVRKNAKIKKRIRVARKRYERRKRLEKKRKDQLKELQQNKEQQKGNVPKKDDSPSPMSRLINAITALLIGFVVNKLPQIIEFVKKIIDFVKGLVDKFKEFFDRFKGFFDGVGKVFENAKNVLKSLTLENIKEKITNFIDKLKNSFGEIKENLLSGVKNFLGLKKKDPKKEDLDIDDNDDNDDKGEKDKKKKKEGLLERVGKSFGKTLETIKRVGTGIDIVGDENKELTSEVDDKKYIRLTLTGVDTNYTVDELESKVDSTKSKINKMEEEGANETRIEFEKDKLDIYEKGIDRLNRKKTKVVNLRKNNKKVGRSSSINSNAKVNNMARYSKFRPKRKSANTIVIMSKGGENSEIDADVSGGRIGFIGLRNQGNNSVHDSLNLALSE
tara:strand:- start:1851 stop:3080 length:1230 start_codon:yes stop_codon:yes gene_type:complete